MSSVQDKNMQGFKKTYVGLVKTLSAKFSTSYPDLAIHYAEIEAPDFDWCSFITAASPQLQTLGPAIVDQNLPALLENMTIPLLAKLHLYELWTSNRLTLNSKKYMWSYLRSLNSYANEFNDIDAPEDRKTSESAEGTGAFTNGIMKMMESIDPSMLTHIGEMMMKGMAVDGKHETGGDDATSNGAADGVPDLSGISKILESINLPALSESVLPAFANASETELQSLFGGIEQVMSVLAKSDQFAGFTDQLTKTMDASKRKIDSASVPSATDID